MAERYLLAEFDSPEALAEAISGLREMGYRNLDAHTPYSTHVVRDAMGRGPSRLPFAICAGGLLGAGGAYFLQWYLVAYLYPLNVGGRPPHMPLAFVPITFEMGVLMAALTGFFAVLIMGGLLKLWDPVFEAEGIESFSMDKFWVSIADDDDRFDTALSVRDVEKFHPNQCRLVNRGSS